MQSRWGTHGDHPVIAISPSSVQETYHEAIRCFNLAEQYRVPVILLMDEIVGHMREGIELLNPDEVVVFNRLTKEDPEQASMPYDIAFNHLDELFLSKNPKYERDWSRHVVARFRQANCASVFVPLSLRGSAQESVHEI
jgi:pyruvate/2-oxoacid:ferredoxin oxidoreductase alpha subunit